METHIPISNFRFERSNLDDELEIRWSRLHISIFDHYILYISNISDLGDMCLTKLLKDTRWNESPGNSSITAYVRVSLAQELQSVFMVPRMKEFHESQNLIEKQQLVEAFISFLLQLLYHKTDSIIDSRMDLLEDLEKELRFLQTVLGDATFMRYVSDYHEDALISKFEAVANEAGSLLHLLLFSTDPAIGELGERIADVMSHVNLLKDDIMKFLLLMSRGAYTTPAKTSVMDSLHVLDSLISDLKDLLNRDVVDQIKNLVEGLTRRQSSIEVLDSLISDLKDLLNREKKLKNLLEDLTSLQSSIKSIGGSQPSEIVELRETLMRIGDTAHEAQYNVISFVVGHAPPWYLINRLTSINLKIELCGSELQLVMNEQKLGEGEVHVAGEFNSRMLFRANRNSEVDDVPVGSEDKEIYLLDKLARGRVDRQVISIFGMPGLGKTTLAKKLYNHRLVSDTFDKVSWCVVSQTYQMHGILATILINIESMFGKDKILSMEEETLVEHIYKTLKGRRYLIVLDDIWESEVLYGLLRCFPDDGNGSRILFTTRNRDLAPPSSFMYEMPYLTDDQCLELLEKKVFSNQSCPPQLQGIGREIAANCRGLPLAVVVIAGILSTIDKNPRSWEEVRRNLASYILDDGDSSVMQILKLSYKHLPHHLKSCFLYLGAFQKDREIHVAKLVRLWVAEGFVRMENKEIKAVDYLTELIDRSLIMVVKRRSDGGVKTCSIHDLFRDLCVKTCEEENFLKFVESSYLSVYNEGDHLQTLQSSVTWSFCQNMRSLFGRSTMLPLHIRDMRLLKVLHFDCISTYLSGIEYLVCLRYLIIRELPPSVVNLVNLEYLHVETNETVYLSSAVMKMKKLRYICVDSEAKYDEDCIKCPTNNLEFLSRIVIEKPEDEEMLKCSPHLCKLKISTCRCVDLSFLTQLDSLDIRFYDIGVKDISFPPNIRMLTLFASNLTSEEMSMIGRLENLEILKLRIISFEDERWDTVYGEFQKVKFLKLKVENLIRWNVDSWDHFPVLERLILSDCGKLKYIPCEIGETLQQIEVQGICTKSLLESAKEVQQEQVDNGNEELRIITNSARVSFEGSDVCIGFEAEAKSIISQLVSDVTKRDIISIVGMPGIGRTTLAKKLFNDPRIIDGQFRFRLWCEVTDKYTIRSLLTKILIASKYYKESEIYETESAEGLRVLTHRMLYKNKYLLVLDDIWDPKVWDALKFSFPDSKNRSRILLTSRNRDVAQLISNYVHELPRLSNDQCWQLLERLVIEYNPCPPKLLEIGKEIAANCRGLPHTVVVTAGLLSSKDREESTWEEVRQDLASHIFDGGNNSVMESSFMNLPEYLRPCLLYFGVFPENEPIHVRELFRFWVAEGFIDKEQEKSAESVAEGYLGNLIDKNLLMVAERRSDGGVKTCLMHDLLRPSCLQICEGQSVRIGEKWRAGPKGGAVDYQHIRSLLGRRWNSPGCVKDARLLRILQCGYIDMRCIGIEFLVCLRYLIIQHLPPSIDSFVNLEYLRVDTDDEVLLPSSVMKMNKLRFIQVGSIAIFDRECEISETNNFNSLSKVRISEPEDEEMLKLSPRLHKLKLSALRRLDLSFLTQLESLNITLHQIGVEGISFPSNIRKLTLKLGSIESRDMSTIGRLENLEVLKLESMSFMDETWDTRKDEFRKLRHLKLDKIFYLYEWNVAQCSHFPNLQRLILRNCYDLEEIPSMVAEIGWLELIEVQGQCPQSLVESAEVIRHEQHVIYGNEMLKIIVNSD